MKRLLAIGVILALIGLCLPLVLFPFASLYYPPLGFWGSLGHMEIRLWETPPAGFKTFNECKLVVSDISICRPDHRVLPYRYPFALGVIMFFTGLALILLATIKREERK